jgi:hypothetical protein
MLMTNFLVTYGIKCVLKHSKSCNEARTLDTLYVWCKLIHDESPMWVYMYFWLLTIDQRGSSYICLYFQRHTFSKIKEKCWQSLQTLHVMEWLCILFFVMMKLNWNFFRRKKLYNHDTTVTWRVNLWSQIACPHSL